LKNVSLGKLIGMIKQRLLGFATLLMAQNKVGILQYVFNNFRRIVFPVVTVYFLLQLFPLKNSTHTNYFIYLYIGLFYLVFVISTAQKVIQWFTLENQRGTIEAISITQVGIEGVIRYLLAFYLFFFFLFEAPAYAIILKYFFGFNLWRHLSFSLFALVVLNVVLIYALTLLGVSMFLFFNIGTFNAGAQRSLFNLIAGAYCPISIFPVALQVVSLALPFTHGLILFRKIITDKTAVGPMDFMPLALFSCGLLILGHFSLKYIIIYIQRKRCFLNY